MASDTLQYLELEYTFFNEAALHGSIPQWMPFMTQGTLSNFWVMISEGIVPLSLTPLAPLLRGVNFLYIFEAGLLFDEFVLLLGCFLLARLYFKSIATVIFVTTAITYTAVSGAQVWWDFHLFYLVPLTLYAFDRGVRQASPKYLFLAGILSVSTLLGNLPYFAPVFAFTIFVFGATIALAAPREVSPVAKSFISRFSWRHLFALVIPSIFIILIGVWYLQWQNAVVQYNVGRTATGQATISDFLTYAGYVGFPKYVELVSRFSNNFNQVIYGGLLLVPFAFVAMTRVRSGISYAFGATGVVLASLTSGTYVSVLFFYFFPLGSFFREIGAMAALVKLFLVFYAGFGFDAFVIVLRKRRDLDAKELLSKDRILLIIPIATVGVIVMLTAMTLSGTFPMFSFPPWVLPTSNQLFVTKNEISSALLSLSLLGAIYFVILATTLVFGKKAKVLLVLLLIVSAADVYSVKVQLEYGQVPQVNQGVVNLFNTYNYTFSMQRSQDYYLNARFATLAPFILGGAGGDRLPGGGTGSYTPPVGSWGPVYWNTESVVYLDAEGSVFRTDSLLYPVARFRSLWNIPPSGLPIPNNTVYLKLTGYTLPKLQLFSVINVLPTENAVAQVLLASSNTGDMIFASATDAPWSRMNSSVVSQSNATIRFTNERLNAAINVEEFSFDSLRVRVNTGINSSSVLYYADAWSPNWHAYVNGIETPVIRTNLGYKSIIVPPGESTISFVYDDWLSQVVIDSIIILALIALCSTIYLFVIDARRKETPPRSRRDSYA